MCCNPPRYRCFIHLERALKRHLKESTFPKPLQYLAKWVWRAVYCAGSGEEAVTTSVGMLCLFYSKNLTVMGDGKVQADTSMIDLFLNKLLQEDKSLIAMVSIVHNIPLFPLYAVLRNMVPTGM